MRHTDPAGPGGLAEHWGLAARVWCVMPGTLGWVRVQGWCTQGVEGWVHRGGSGGGTPARVVPLPAGVPAWCPCLVSLLAPAGPSWCPCLAPAGPSWCPCPGVPVLVSLACGPKRVS